MDNIRRRILFIDKDFQIKFIAKFCVIVILSSVLVGALLLLFSENFTTVAIENTQVVVKNMSNFILPIIIETVSIVTVFTALAVVILTLFVSHKISGPLYRLKKEIDVFKSGYLKANFKTRKSDQLKELTTSLYEMGNSLADKHLELKNKLAALKTSLQDPAEDKGVILKKLNELEQVLSYFKI